MTWYQIAFQAALMGIYTHYFIGRKLTENHMIEGPVPPVVGKKKEEWRTLFPGAKPFVALCQINMTAMLASGFAIIYLTKSNVALAAILLVLIPIHLLVARLLEIKVSGLRGPSRIQADLLNSLARKNGTVRARLVDIQKHGKLTFAEARELLQEYKDEIAFEDQPAQKTRQITLPNRTSGSPLSFSLLSGDITFYPYEDGWYRAFVIDDRVHKMLCNGAAGDDAGVYHQVVNDRCLGMWSIPSSFTGEIADRIARLSAIHKSNDDSGPKMPPPDDPPGGGSPVFA